MSVGQSGAAVADSSAIYVAVENGRERLIVQGKLGLLRELLDALGVRAGGPEQGTEGLAVDPAPTEGQSRR